MSHDFPSFIFISPYPHQSEHSSLNEAWRKAVSKYFEEEERSRFSILQGKLQDIDPSLLQCDCMVSPANSFGIMDGGYDYDLSLAFMGETKDVKRLTHHVQSQLHTRWSGYAPPASCTLMPLPSDVAGPGRNPWSAKVLAVVPTMRIPQDVSWHKDLVYNCMWTLLSEISLWNRSKTEDERITRVLMTGLATGTGKLNPKVCGEQMVLATKHWLHDLPPELNWPDVMPRAREIEHTFKDDAE